MPVGIPLGPYLLVRRLATGGMAEIFLARKEGPEGFQRDLVVKRILPHLSADQSFTSMFLDEARIAARLAHPNVVHVYDFGEVDGSYYLAMELVRGVDLHATIRRAADKAKAEGRHGTAVPPHHAAKILSVVCEGLAHAHSLVIDGKPAGLVHRDMSPSNVLISFDGAIKVADFGIAKAERGLRTDVTVHGQVKGKYAYMSPEQARGERLDSRSDLFNVGLMLVEAITGESVFPLHDYRAAKIMSASGTIPNAERIDQLPGSLPLVVRRALAYRAADRYPDAFALRADLEAFLRTWTEHSDTVEIGAYVRELFPDVLAEDARAPRAAGTVPATAAAISTGDVPVNVYDDGPTTVGQAPKAGDPPRRGARAGAAGVAGGTAPIAPSPTTPVDPDLTVPRRSRPEGLSGPGGAPTPARARTPGPRPGTPVLPPVAELGKTVFDEEEAETDPPLAGGGDLVIFGGLTPPSAGSAVGRTPAGVHRAASGHTPGPASAVRTPTPTEAALAELPTRLAPIPRVEPGTLASPEVAMEPQRPGRRSSLVLMVAGGIAAAVLGAAAWQIFGGDAGPEPPTSPAGEPPLPPRVPPPVAGTVRVTSEPPGLDLTVDRRPHGTTPAILSLASEVPHEIAIVRGGQPIAFTTVVLAAAEDRELVLRDPAASMVDARVSTTPEGAMAIVDDVEVGRTPLQVPLAPGEHHLRLALAGHVTQEATVHVEPGERPTFSFALAVEPLPVVQVEPVPPERDPIRRNNQHHHPDRNPPPRPTGTLTIATTPWSSVYLGSRRLGTTPLANVRLPAGTHVLTLKAPGRPDRRHTVTIEAGQEARVRLAL